MRAVIALAAKDLRLLLRIKSGWFFTLVWPVLVAVFFGLLFGGPGSGSARLKVAVVDEDASPRSREFVARLGRSAGIETTPLARAEALDLVRRGERVGAVVLPAGFGEAAGRLFHGAPPRIETWMDPSRKAEAGMLEGLLFQQAAAGLQELMTDPVATRRMTDQALKELAGDGAIPAEERARVERFLGELDRFVGAAAPPDMGTTAGGATGATCATGATSAGTGAWQPLVVEAKELRRERRGPASPFEVTFPQGVIWGILGCVMTFGIGIVSERTHGTLVRLEMSPLTRGHILAGKAIACFVAIVTVESGMFLIGRVAFGVRPSSLPLLAVAGLAVAVCFVGIMMLVSSLGKTEQAASGAGWAVLMPLSMVGGGMIPLFAMPAWMTTVSNLSPIKWAILSFEGALWRGFGPREMLLPVAILVAAGAVAFLAGVRAFDASRG